MSNECSICCTEVPASETYATVKCGHIFHKQCIEEWITRSNQTCPDCRNPVESVIQIFISSHSENMHSTNDRSTEIYKNKYKEVLQINEKLSRENKFIKEKIENLKTAFVSIHLNSGEEDAAHQQILYRGDTSLSLNSSDAIDVNIATLNRCFDNIEAFVARIQSAAMTQREIEIFKRGKKEVPRSLQLRAQMPQSAECYEILQKFKLSINILALVQDNIHSPDASELLHFLFVPLKVIVDACHGESGQNIAVTVKSPLLSFEAIELLKQYLSNDEFDFWMSLGQYWRMTT